MSGSSSVGINLTFNDYYGTDFPFINRMKSAGSWIGAGTIPLDAEGYPTALPAGDSSIYTMVGLDPLSAGTDTTYVLTYTGTANFVLVGASIISSEPGKIVFQFAQPDYNQMLLAVSNLDSNAPLGNMAIVRSDQVALYNQGEIFNPEFISKLSAFDTLRFMDWGNTNLNQVQNWSDRTTMDDRTWQDNGNSSVPIEVEVALANETKTNMWLNVPTEATDDYVRQMMTYVHNNLDPSLTVHLEYSNEMWNFGFQQSQYAAQQGAALFDKDANGDGVINQNDPAEHNAGDWVIYYGYRAAQVANIANQVYGADDDRLDNVLTTQTVYQGLENYIFDGIARANVGSVSTLFKDYAVTTYFDGMLRGANAADQATILSWAKSGDAGLTAAFAAIENGAGLTATDSGSLAWLRGVVAYQAAIAQQYGLNLVSYEGGVDLTTSTAVYGADAATVTAFFKRLQSDPRMGAAYTQLIDDFAANGGTLLNALVDADPGFYGTLKSIYDDGSPEWNALVAAEATAKGLVPGTPPVVTPPVVTTPVVTTPVVTTPVVTTPVVTTPVVTPPVVTTPVVTTPVVTTPVVTTPVVTTPVVTTPVVTTPVVTTPVVTTPVVTTPVVTTPVVTTPVVATPVVTTPVVTTPVVTTPVVTTPVVTTPVVTTPVVATPVVTTPVVTTPVVATPIVTTPLSILSAGTTEQASYVFGASETSITYVGTGMFTAVGNDLGDTITAGGGGSTLTGGRGTDTLIGGAGNDFLDGGAGIDRMVGGAGDDTYVVDDYRDQVVEMPNGGTDTVRTALGAYVLPTNVENLTYTGTQPFQALGNDLDNVLTGGVGANRLSGGGGNDTLIGGAGDDVLDGGSGADRMVGGAGNDVYFVDNSGDQVVEDVNAGTDTVFSSIDYTLPENVENLTLLPGAIIGTGNALDNIITGNAADNHLSGGAGNDTLIAGSGNDVLDGGDGDDTLIGGPGADLLTGGTGADRFVFRAGSLSADPAKTSTITDFSRSDGDRIDLSGFDANLATTASDSFTFIGTAAFDGHAGELRIDTVGAYQVVYGDLNGDGIADFALNVSKGSGSLISADFVL